MEFWLLWCLAPVIGSSLYFIFTNPNPDDDD